MSGYSGKDTKELEPPLFYVLAVRAGEAGGRVSLPKTGQTTSHATGDDGDLQMGVAWPDPRFTDNGYGIIYDNLTGLMWEQESSGTMASWADALDYANDLVLCGHSDWRLPNVNELESLLNLGEAEVFTWLNSQGFRGVLGWPAYYCSSTTCLYDGDPPELSSAWYVRMQEGILEETSKDTSSVDYYVLAVRSGQ